MNNKGPIVRLRAKTHSRSPKPFNRVSVTGSMGVQRLSIMLPYCTEQQASYAFVGARRNSLNCGSYSYPCRLSIHSDSGYNGSPPSSWTQVKNENNNENFDNFGKNQKQKHKSSSHKSRQSQSPSGPMSLHDPSVPSTSTSTAIPIPPNLLRGVNGPPKSAFTRLRLCLRLNDTDLSNPRIQFEDAVELDADPLFTFTVGSNRIYSDNAYHTVFGPTTTQTQLCASCLPELLQALFSGQDASMMYFGAISRAKQDLLYSRVPTSPMSDGIFVTALQWIFRLVDEYKTRRRDTRFSIRISALHYSQKTDRIIDLLADAPPLTPDSGDDGSGVNGGVRCSEDPVVGIVVDNRSEIRVENVDQALLYLDRVYDHRVTEEEELQRTSHTFFYVTLYRYNTATGNSEGDASLQACKSRLCFLDLGLGEKNSKTGFMTMPVLGNILLAIFQGQKHLPSRTNTLCRLLKESIGNSRNKSTVVLSSYSQVENRCPIETENLVQLAAKMHKTAKKSTTYSPSSRRPLKSESGPHAMESGTEYYTSSSEQSCADTVIFVGPHAAPTAHSSVLPPPLGYNGTTTLPPLSAAKTALHRRDSKHSSGRRSNESIPSDIVIPIDCPPNAVVHSSASFHSMSLHGSPKHRPVHLFHRGFGSMPGTPTHGNRSGRQGSVPADLILCNPMAVGSGSSLKRSKRLADPLEGGIFNIDPEKRAMVLNWVMDQKLEYGADVCGIGKPFPDNKVDASVQCNEEEIDSELLNVWNQARYLDDIVEDDEEPSTASALSRHKGEALADSLEPSPTSNQPLSILTKVSDVLKDDATPDMSDDELEKAMAASISSMKSHEILSRLVTDFTPVMQDSLTLTDSKPPTETDFYRRASALEAYAAERVRQLVEEKDAQPNNAGDLIQHGVQKLRDTILKQLQCTSGEESVTAMDKTGSSENLENTRPQNNEIFKLEFKEKHSLLAKLKLKQLSCCAAPMTTSIASSTSIGTNTIVSSFSNRNNVIRSVKVEQLTAPGPTITPDAVRQIKDELRNAGLDRTALRHSQSSHNSPSRIPNLQSQPAHSMKDLRRGAPGPAKTTKKTVVSRRSSDASGTTALPSPYTKITTAKPMGNRPQTSSSGHGSDEAGGGTTSSAPSPPLLPQPPTSLMASNKNRPRNRESFSASSGYESADYGRCKKATLAASTAGNTVYASLKKNQSNPAVLANKEIQALRHVNSDLVAQLEEARRRLGLPIDPAPTTTASAASDHQSSPDAIISLLKQENQVLERKLLACKNHVKMVTTFL